MTAILWGYIYEWKEFICLSAGFTILFSFIVPIGIKRFDYRKEAPALFYLLYGLRRRQAAALAAAFLQTLLVIYCILFRKNIEMNSLMALLILQMVIVAGNLKLKHLITGVLNCIFVFIALICANIMFRYLDEIRMDSMILVIYLLLNLFVTAYAVYMCILHMQQISGAATKRRARDARKKEEELEEMAYEEA